MGNVDPIDPEADAQRLVGKFLQSFALLEQSLDSGISKLLDLGGPKGDIVCSSIPFAKKLGVFFSAEGLLAALPDTERKKLIKSTRSSILALNQQRVMFAHNPFSAASPDGLRFRRVVADTRLDVSDVHLSAYDVEQLCASAKIISEQIENIVLEMKPYVSSANFSDPRNSALIALL